MILYLSGLYFGSKSSHPESARQTSDEVCTSWAKAQLSGTSQGWRVPRGSEHGCLCLWAGWLDLPSALFYKNVEIFQNLPHPHMELLQKKEGRAQKNLSFS